MVGELKTPEKSRVFDFLWKRKKTKGWSAINESEANRLANIAVAAAASEPVSSTVTLALCMIVSSCSPLSPVSVLRSAELRNRSPTPIDSNTCKNSAILSLLNVNCDIRNVVWTYCFFKTIDLVYYFLLPSLYLSSSKPPLLLTMFCFTCSNFATCLFNTSFVNFYEIFNFIKSLDFILIFTFYQELEVI